MKLQYAMGDGYHERTSVDHVEIAQIINLAMTPAVAGDEETWPYWQARTDAMSTTQAFIAEMLESPRPSSKQKATETPKRKTN